MTPEDPGPEAIGPAIPHRIAGYAGGFSTRRAGDLDERGGAAEPWARFRAATGLAGRPIVLARQVHGARVVVVESAHLWRARPTGLEGVFRSGEADALVTAAPGIAVAVRTADCLPVLLGDADGRACGAVHAGWRGIAADVIGAAVRALAGLGAPAAGLRAVLGPAIGRPCYEVGAEVAEAWRAAVPEADRALERAGGGRWRADLALAARLQLEAAGLAPAAIRDLGLCTACDAAHFFSYRRDGASTGRQVSAIAIDTRGGTPVR